jgi:hypothetical protein
MLETRGDEPRYREIIATTLSTTLRPASASQTAKQTKILQRMPLKNASQNGKVALAAAILTALMPTDSLFVCQCCDQRTNKTRPNAPTRLARYTMTQLRISSAVVIRRLAQAHDEQIVPSEKLGAGNHD